MGLDSREAVAAQARHRAVAMQNQVSKWAQAHTDEYEFLRARHQRSEDGSETQDNFYESLWGQLNHKGDLSVRQVDALRKSASGYAQRQAEAAARAAQQKARADARAAEMTAPCPVGRTPIGGRLLSVRWHEDSFGGRLAMTVRDDRGFKVWGTVPREVVSALDELQDEVALPYHELVRVKDIRVTFTATLTPNEDDPAFGFAKRPSAGHAELATADANS